MKKFIVMACVMLIFIIAFKLGQDNRQDEMERRSLELAEKDCFSNQDIEHILFNLPQE
jgi:hypothetical protein